MIFCRLNHTCPPYNRYVGPIIINVILLCYSVLYWSHFGTTHEPECTRQTEYNHESSSAPDEHTKTEVSAADGIVHSGVSGPNSLYSIFSAQTAELEFAPWSNELWDVMVGCGLIRCEDLYFLTVHCICNDFHIIFMKLIHNRVWGVSICGLDTVITLGCLMLITSSKWDRKHHCICTMRYEHTDLRKGIYSFCNWMGRLYWGFAVLIWSTCDLHLLQDLGFRSYEFFLPWDHELGFHNWHRARVRCVLHVFS
jgi:hypothetical protein